jgi:hypothetical protein
MTATKYCILFFCCYLLSCGDKQNSTGSSYFEGIISYESQFIRKTDRYDSLLMERAIGNTSKYYYKGGNEITKTPGTLSPWSLYRVADNKAYFTQEGVDTLYWESCAGPGSKILSAVITADKEMVLGILCDELKVVYEDRTVISYFNSDTLRINPVLHSAKTLTNDHFYAEKKKALSLKFVIDKPDYKVTYTATKITPATLGDDFFSIPAGMPLSGWK